MTNAEIILWSRLRHDAVYGRRFRRQHPVGPSITTSLRGRASLWKWTEKPIPLLLASHDHRRNTYLRARGWHVFRVTEDVYKNLNSVLDGIDLRGLRRTPRERGGKE
jgi:very-short-patch-repair endonuclease